MPIPTSPPGNSLLRLTDSPDNSDGPLLSDSVLPSPSTPAAPAIATLRCFRFLKKMKAAIKRAKSTARGIPTPRPIFAAIESPRAEDGSGLGDAVDSGPAETGGCCLSEDSIPLAPGLDVRAGEFEPVDDSVVEAEVMPVVVMSAKSSALYLIPGRQNVSIHSVEISSRKYGN